VHEEVGFFIFFYRKDAKELRREKIKNIFATLSALVVK